MRKINAEILVSFSSCLEGLIDSGILSKKFSHDQTFPGIKINLDSKSKSDRRKWVWTDTNSARGQDVVEILKKYRDHWPMTERSIYYRLISNSCINKQHWRKNNNPDQPRIKDLVGALGTLLKWLRIDEYVPWRAIVDEQRLLTDKAGYSSPDAFVEEEMDYLLNGYRRCMAKRQEYYIEVWLEKQTLLHIVKPVTDKYCRRLMCCKGYNSITFQNDFFNRANDAIGMGQKPVVLYFGDWDPSGENMIYAAAQTLIDEMGLFGVDFYRCGINPEHFHLLQENPDPVPIKNKDSRARRFVESHGATAYELDAFEPDDLKKLVEDSILAFTDMDAVKQDQEDEQHDREILEQVKQETISFMKELISEGRSDGWWR